MIKTTKETHKQDETFKSKVTFDSYDNVYANVDGEMKSLPDYIASKSLSPSNMVTTDTEQEITGTKYFDKLRIRSSDGLETFDIDALNKGTTSYPSGNEVNFKRESTAGSSYSLNKFNFYSASRDYILTICVGDVSDKVFFVVRSSPSDNPHVFRIPYVSSNYSRTLACEDTINATTALTLTNVSGHRYTGTISTSNKVECIVDIDGTYTANFNIAKGMKTAFLMVYGTSSTDVATCFATMDSSGLVTIDLDNVSLSSFTPTCKYIIYN